MGIDLKALRKKRQEGTLKTGGRSGGGVLVPAGELTVKLVEVKTQEGFKDASKKNLCLVAEVVSIEKIDEADSYEGKAEDFVGKKFSWWFPTNVDADHGERLLGDLLQILDALGEDEDKLLTAEDVDTQLDIYIEFLDIIQKKVNKDKYPTIEIGRAHQVKDPKYFDNWVRTPEIKLEAENQVDVEEKDDII